MKNYLLLLLSILLAACGSQAGKTESTATAGTIADSLIFTVIDEVPTLPLANQQASGTCWAFSTTSFLEAEIYRTKGEFIKLSEMYFVRNVYLQKAQNFILRQGTARFTEGGCNFDPLIGIDRMGIMPLDAYSGLVNGATFYDHRKLVEELSARVKEFADPGNKLGAAWKTAVPAILDAHLGTPSHTFNFADSVYSATGFLEYTGINPGDYINITTFTHSPQDEYFILQIPANWSNMSYFNVSLDEYMDNIDYALGNGYSLAIDVDIFEPGFHYDKGLAFLPEGDSIITPEKRQLDFESFATTDDHNMHLIGKVKDQQGKVYYKCKNSWGEAICNGYYYLSEPYVRSKSIYVMLHKDGLLETTREKAAAAATIL